MHIFISWSGTRSKVFSELLYEFLARLLHPLKPWMSSKNIEKGAVWNQEINEKLSTDIYGIICITPENQSAPWLLFESGALSKVMAHNKIFPLLIGMDHEDFVLPLNQFQATLFTKTDFYELINTINNGLGENKKNDLILSADFKLHWPGFEKKVDSAFQKIHFDKASDIFPKILDSLRNSGIPKPHIGQTVTFKEGFETHSMYDCILKLAKKRIYIFGRKNRKLFDKDHFWFFKDLIKKINTGFDFRIFFLDIDAPKGVLNSAHMDVDFPEQLASAQKQALNVLAQFGLSHLDIFKKYNVMRSFSFCIVDDAVLFTPVSYDLSSTESQVTNSSFTLTSVDSNQGEILLKNFIALWEVSKSLKNENQ